MLKVGQSCFVTACWEIWLHGIMCSCSVVCLLEPFSVPSLESGQRFLGAPLPPSISSAGFHFCECMKMPTLQISGSDYVIWSAFWAGNPSTILYSLWTWWWQHSPNSHLWCQHNVSSVFSFPSLWVSVHRGSNFFLIILLCDVSLAVWMFLLLSLSTFLVGHGTSDQWFHHLCGVYC